MLAHLKIAHFGLKLHLIWQEVNEILGIETVPCNPVGPEAIVLEVNLHSWISVIPNQELPLTSCEFVFLYEPVDKSCDTSTNNRLVPLNHFGQ